MAIELCGEGTLGGRSLIPGGEAEGDRGSRRNRAVGLRGSKERQVRKEENTGREEGRDFRKRRSFPLGNGAPSFREKIAGAMLRRTREEAKRLYH